LILRARDYIEYIRANKQPRAKTLQSYEDTLKHIAIPEVDTEDMSPTYQTLLKDKLPTIGYVDVKRFIAILSAWAKKNNTVLTKDIHYHTLLDQIKLKSKARVREAYTDIELINIFAALSSNRAYSGLYNLCLLLLYSGIRISSAEGIKWESVKKVEGYPVYSFPVIGKGTPYYAIISEKAIDYIREHNYGSSTVIYRDRFNVTSFDALYRKSL
jgi:hypothetical protein